MKQVDFYVVGVDLSGPAEIQNKGGAVFAPQMFASM